MVMAGYLWDYINDLTTPVWEQEGGTARTTLEEKGAVY